MKKYKYKVCNLDCPNCAKKVEDRLNKEEELIDVVINFSNLTLSLKSNKEIDRNYILKKAREVEPNIDILLLNEEKKEKNYRLIRLIIGIVLLLISHFINFKYNIINEIILIISYLILLSKTFIIAVKTLFKSHIINENALITISCIGAYLINEKMEGLMVIILYEIGKILEDMAVNKSRKSIKELMDISQDYANLLDGEKEEKISIEDVKIGDILIVKKGEKVPVDSVIISGTSKFDLSSLTGESDLVTLNKADEVLSGSINAGEVIKVKALKIYEDSTVSRILTLIEEASDKKSKTENFVTKVSKYYTPGVIIISILTFIILNIFHLTVMSESIYRSLTFLVVSCPCAIAISIPLSYYTSIGVSSKHGILVKGSNYLDMLSNAKKIIFDKTGTITSGSFSVKDLEVISDKYDVEYIKEVYAKVEKLSNHPIAKSIVDYLNIKTSTKDIKDYIEVEGKGIVCRINDKTIKVGNSKILSKKLKSDDNKIYLEIDNELVSSIIIDDGIKENVKETINELKKNNIDVYMFTGDHKDNALNISRKVGIDNVCYELLPTEKYDKLEEMIKKDEFVIFVGDGINDAPLLKRADIGISMGQIGSSSAIEASDIVIMDDDISKISKSIQISKYTKKIIKQNLIFALLVKLTILILCVVGISTMWQAVFTDVGVTVLCILNTLRIMKK